MFSKTEVRSRIVKICFASSKEEGELSSSIVLIRVIDFSLIEAISSELQPLKSEGSCLINWFTTSKTVSKGNTRTVYITFKKIENSSFEALKRQNFSNRIALAGFQHSPWKIRSENQVLESQPPPIPGRRVCK